MVSERIGDANYVDHDEWPERTGWLGSLLSFFRNKAND
jgi:hypothetical protein